MGVQTFRMWQDRQLEYEPSPPFMPERRCWCAVLMRGYDDIIFHMSRRTRESYIRAVDARDWFQRKKRKSSREFSTKPYSHWWACHVALPDCSEELFRRLILFSDPQIERPLYVKTTQIIAIPELKRVNKSYVPVRDIFPPDVIHLAATMAESFI